jgi:S-adenosylmethionine:diacylglycerol 3-amino-3-carboxypropyl transferase
VLEGDHKRKKVVIPAKLVLDQMGNWKPGEKFTRLVINLIGGRKSGYYDNPVKKLSFPRKRESRETMILNFSLFHQGAKSVFCD